MAAKYRCSCGLRIPATLPPPLAHYNRMDRASRQDGKPAIDKSPLPNDLQLAYGYETGESRAALMQASPKCTHCDAPQEDGHHVTFTCPYYAQQRRELIGEATTWEVLDTPIWKKGEGEEEGGMRWRRNSPTSTAPSLDVKGHGELSFSGRAIATARGRAY
ncbi:hypothetical protein EV426DRAFT_702411 [Tirmania nivea]|nr:hypothetical protein EV426DRAFT_702411 [Tirmania nivea]